MKRMFLMACVTVALSASAQTEQKAIIDSKSYDNWYIGVNGGVATKTSHNVWKDNLNLNGGVRVGRWFTPAFGLAFESNAYFGNKPKPSTGTIVKYLNTGLAATINLSNWWFGYPGQPRFFEVIALPGLGMGHVFGNEDKVAQNLNDMTAKLALDFAFNIDKKKSLQLYLEPAMLYALYGNTSTNTDLNMNVNRSYFQVNIGVIYKFKNTNGTHNFKYAEPVMISNDVELSRLNDRISELESENAALKNAHKPTATTQVIEKINKTIDPVVTFPKSSSVIESLQYPNIENMAKYMKNNKDIKLKVTGYASTEGTKELNQKLSEARAEAVKHALITKYGISADRIEIAGDGATDTLSSERAYNRIAIMSVLE